MSKPLIAAINGGSSSIKFALFEASSSLREVMRDEISGIGSLSDLLKKIEGELVAVGHRITHGGPKYSKPERISKAMLGELRKMSPFDPEHLPEELLLIEAFSEKFPKLPQVACFDTAFHRDLPRVAQLLPIPRRYEAQGVRRYGFHGLSYAFLLGELERLAGPKVAHGRVILAHLGNGASLSAVRGGKSIDTTMAFTPTAGIPMSTRSGNLDPGLASYLAQTEGFDVKRWHQMVNFESGLLGVSETSSDMRDLLSREKEDVRAAEAIALFCYEVKKAIGAFAAALGGVDTLVFSGGIGENAPVICARICEGLEFLGISKEQVRVIHTDEEFMIAKMTHLILGTSEEKR